MATCTCLLDHKMTWKPIEDFVVMFLRLGIREYEQFQLHKTVSHRTVDDGLCAEVGHKMMQSMFYRAKLVHSDGT